MVIFNIIINSIHLWHIIHWSWQGGISGIHKGLSNESISRFYNPYNFIYLSSLIFSLFASISSSSLLNFTSSKFLCLFNSSSIIHKLRIKIIIIPISKPFIFFYTQKPHFFLSKNFGCFLLWTLISSCSSSCRNYSHYLFFLITPFILSLPPWIKVDFKLSNCICWFCSNFLSLLYNNIFISL